MSTATDWLNEEKQELAVERILEAASGVFSCEGIRNARMGKIAEAAGCSRATLYRYFPNKEALLHAYMLHIARDFRTILSDRLRGMRALGKRIVEAVAVSAELIQSREDVAPFFTEEGVGLTAQLTANAAAMRDQLATQLEQESCSPKIQGQLRADVTPAEAAEWVTRAIFSLATVPVEARSGPALRKYLRKMLIPALIAD
ncbi:MAG: TetR/AcrR family transcriptional regulator [Myxococcales bacterium]|nr:TetR/AcrR family transcriptional regulator [Myxococcales bacterium]